MQWYMYVIIAVAAVVIIGGIIFKILKDQKISKNGIEADAVVSRIKETETREEDGTYRKDYVYYVKYRNEAGQMVEAKLNTTPRQAVVGTQLRVKYLPEKPNYAVIVK